MAHIAEPTTDMPPVDAYAVMRRTAEDGVIVEYVAPRRLYPIAAAAAMLGVNRAALASWVRNGALPSITLPSTSRDPARRMRVIPAVWMPRYLTMASDRAVPVWTSRADIGDPRERAYVSIRVAAQLAGLAPTTLYALLTGDAVQIPVHRTPGGDLRIRLADLDTWVHAMVADAEAAWYAGRGAAATATLEAVICG